MVGIEFGEEGKMKVKIRTRIILENDQGQYLIGDSIEESIYFDDKWSVRNALEVMRERSCRLFERLRRLV